MLVCQQRVRYSTALDSRNKFGLTQLIAEPWQRIPRYTLLFNTMLKHMAMNHLQRAPLEEAIQYATAIAKAETDAETQRMAIMHCLSTSIEDFPVSLISNSRQFVDCVDVQDVLGPEPHAPISSTGPTSAGMLHCTLFLFDDKVMIVKRPAEKSGRTLAGLDPPHFDKVVKGGTLPSSMRKNGLVCKGLVDITEVNATDIGGPGMPYVSIFHCHLPYSVLRLPHLPRERAPGPVRAMGWPPVSCSLGRVSPHISWLRSYTHRSRETSLSRPSVGCTGSCSD